MSTGAWLVELNWVTPCLVHSCCFCGGRLRGQGVERQEAKPRTNDLPVLDADEADAMLWQQRRQGGVG